MIRFAVIGTNWITRQFVEAAHESGKYKLTAVYSRSLEQAQHFANDFSVEHLFTSLEAMAKAMPLTRCILPARMPCTFPRHNFSLATKFM